MVGMKWKNEQLTPKLPQTGWDMKCIMDVQMLKIGKCFNTVYYLVYLSYSKDWENYVNKET